MRKLITLSLACLTALSVFAFGDGQGCGAVLPANHHLNTTDAERSGIYTPDASRGGVRYVPITYHIIAKTNGTQGVSLKTIFDTHCELNIDFTNAQIKFYIYSIDTIKDDALWAMSDGNGGTNYNLGYGAFSTYNVANSVNAYISGGLPGLCGFATFPNSAPNGGGLFLNAACCGVGGKTIGHEMGHFFNLPHTFQQSNPVEYVTRGASANCATKGDRFCDTPADFLGERTPCPYNGNETDPRGDLYRTDLDETLIMSYFNDNCVYRFSNQQEAEMNSTLSTDRDELLVPALPDVTPLDSAQFISPQNNDSTSLASAISFRWQSIPGAVYYRFRLQPATSSLVLVDTVIKETFFNVGNLQANKSYRYYAKGISFGNVCDAQAPFKYLQTSVIKATFSTVAPSCAGQNDGVIAITPSNGMAPYTINWSNSQTGNTITNLASGSYTVTITDNNGKVAVATIQLGNTAPVSGTITPVGFNLNADATGGTPPYTYAWSNGVNSQFNNNIQFGSYTLTITDSKGCTDVQTFVFSSVKDSKPENVGMKLYPNPATNAAALSVELVLPAAMPGTVVVMNTNGQVVQQTSKELISGNNYLLVDISQLQSGVYVVKFTGEGAVASQRITIMR